MQPEVMNVGMRRDVNGAQDVSPMLVRDQGSFSLQCA